MPATPKTSAYSAAATPPQRIEWVDYAKGFCICFVLAWHSTLGVEKVAGHASWMHEVITYSTPFRMPDFFLISGLFLSRVINRDWRTYLDKRVYHFAYFYVLWMTIQFAVKAPVFAAEFGWLGTFQLYLKSFIDPFGSLWFIYLLPVFFITTKLVRNVPPVIVWSLGAALEIAHIDSGNVLIDEFTSRFVYFYTGYLFATQVFSLTAAVQRRPLLSLAGLSVWAVVNGALVFEGWSALPLVSLGLGLVGAIAVVTVSTLPSMVHFMSFLRYCGEKSLQIYLCFFLPMAAMRTVLLKTGVVSNLGTVSVITTVAAIAGAIAIEWALRNTFLFTRPKMFRFEPKREFSLQPAE